MAPPMCMQPRTTTVPRAEKKRRVARPRGPSFLLLPSLGALKACIFISYIRQRPPLWQRMDNFAVHRSALNDRSIVQSVLVRKINSSEPDPFFFSVINITMYYEIIFESHTCTDHCWCEWWLLWSCQSHDPSSIRMRSVSVQLPEQRLPP